MCITFFYLDPNPTGKLPFKLILAFNRDELASRPTDELAFWKDDPNILAGRDVVAFGTWLGVNIKTGNIAILTNIKRPLWKRVFVRNQGIFSRGRLTSSFLKSDFFKKRTLSSKDIIDPIDEMIEQYMKEIHENKDAFDPFNLILGNLKTMTFRYMNNQHEGNMPLLLPSGIHGMSNSRIEEEWPKVILGKRLMSKILDDMLDSNVKEEDLIERLQKMMSNNTKFSWFDFMESSIFIDEWRLPFCETRKTKTTSIILFNKKNELTFVETRHRSGYSLYTASKDTTTLKAKIDV